MMIIVYAQSMSMLISEYRDSVLLRSVGNPIVWHFGKVLKRCGIIGKTDDEKGREEEIE